MSIPFLSACRQPKESVGSDFRWSTTRRGEPPKQTGRPEEEVRGRRQATSWQTQRGNRRPQETDSQ